MFGKEYGVMLKNDLHAGNSIDHKFLREMILLDEESYSFLYLSGVPGIDNMNGHELFDFAQQFRVTSDKESIKNVLDFTKNKVKGFNVEFSNMIFGGTEKEILERGTDWCADMARVGAVLLECMGIPARIVHLANLSRAYNGHVVVEAYYEGKYGVCDFISGYLLYNSRPLDAAELWRSLTHDNKKSAEGGWGCLSQVPELISGIVAQDKLAEYVPLFTGVAINEYFPMNPGNDYSTSMANDYYLKMIDNAGREKGWFMGEAIL